MEQSKLNVREQLHDSQQEIGLLIKTACSEEQNVEYLELLKNGGTLPQNVFPFISDSGAKMSRFYSIREADLTEQEKVEYYTLKKLKLLKSIRNCLIFFVVLTILGFVCGLITAFTM